MDKELRDVLDGIIKNMGGDHSTMLALNIFSQGLTSKRLDAMGVSMDAQSTLLTAMRDVIVAQSDVITKMQTDIEDLRQQVVTLTAFSTGGLNVQRH